VGVTSIQWARLRLSGSALVHHKADPWHRHRRRILVPELQNSSEKALIAETLLRGHGGIVNCMYAEGC
jgi:hypothetical protein